MTGANFEIHLADSLTPWSHQGAEHRTLSKRRLHRFVHHLQIAAVTEFQASQNWLARLLR